MLGAEIAGWISAVTGIVSLGVAITALVKSNKTKSNVQELEKQINIMKSNIQQPIIISGGAGGGGGAGPGGIGGAGGSNVNYDGSQK